MGRAHQVREKAMAATAAAKSALYNRMSRDVYLAAKSGVPDVKMNISLRAAVDKAKKAQVPSHVIENAIKKAAGGDGESFSSVRYEGYGPGNSQIIIDAMTDNVNRAYTAIRTVMTRCGGKLGVGGCVSHSFNNTAVVEFTGLNVDQTTEALLLVECEIQDVFEEDGSTFVYAAPEGLEEVQNALQEAGVTEFLTAEKQYLPFETITLNDEETGKFNRLLDGLDEVEDVQNVYHNVKF